MAIATFSRFYYGYDIVLSPVANNKFDFDEGAGELTAEISLGVFSPTQTAVELEQELNATGTDVYTVTFNRSTRGFDITSDGTFSILIDTGTNKASGLYSLLGFTGSADLATAASHVSDSASGSEYVSQFFPQDYVAADFRREKGDASVNVSADGTVEVISFGDVRHIEMDLLFITDIVMDGHVIRNNPTGVSDAIDFMTFLIKRGPIEFMPDQSDAATFFTVILDRTPEDGKGTKFTLKEETSKNLPGIYKTGKLVFRIVE